MKNSLILRKLAEYVDSNPDLIQASGGNISYKYDKNIMRIKASGKRIKEINKRDGFVDVYYKQINKKINIKNNYSKINLDDFKVEKVSSRVSIEVYFHAILDKIVLHTHPVMLNTILCSLNAKSLIKSIFGSKNFINYIKPGYQLGLEIQNRYIKNSLNNDDNSEFYLQNHGLILSGNNVDEIIKRSEMIEKLSQKFLNSQKTKFKIFDIPRLIYSNLNIFLCKNEDINNFINTNFSLIKKATNPDTVIFCGPEIFFVNPNTFIHDIKLFFKNYKTIPKVYLYNKKFYILTENTKSKNAIEEVLLSHLKITSNIFFKIKSLSKIECQELLSRDDEKYRLNLISK